MDVKRPRQPTEQVALVKSVPKHLTPPPEFDPSPIRPIPRASAPSSGLSAGSREVRVGPESALQRRHLVFGRYAMGDAARAVTLANKFGSFDEAVVSVAHFPLRIVEQSRFMLSTALAREGNRFEFGPEDDPPPEMTNAGPGYGVIHYLARVSQEHGVGNCGEKAGIAAMALVKEGLRPVEIFGLRDGDHGFAVVGRDPRSDPADPLTWGPDAVIVDPWYEEVYPANEIASHMKNGGQVPPLQIYALVAR